MASPASVGAQAAVTTSLEERADDLRHLLRQKDQLLERWARQMAHPEGIGPTPEDLRELTQSLIRLELRVEPLAEVDPGLVTKHAALVRRGKELTAAASAEEAERTNLVVLDESIRWLEVPGAALIASGQSGVGLAQTVCDAAAEIGLETRGIPGFAGDTEALLRFVKYLQPDTKAIG